MTTVEALAEYDGSEPSLFLAGGISGTVMDTRYLTSWASRLGLADLLERARR